MDQDTKYKALTLGIYNKIDHSNTDQTYIQKWSNKIKEVFELIQKAPKEEINNISEIDPKYFFNFNKAIIDIKKNIHEDYELDYFRNELEKQREVKKENGISFESKIITKTCHAIDLDYEYRHDGAYVCIYSRDISSDETFTVMYRYDDYFYIEIEGENTVESIQTKLNGYLWFLKNYRFPDSAVSVLREPEKYYGHDMRHHDSKVNIENDLIVKTEVIEDHKSVYGYNPNNAKFLKIYTRYPTVSEALFRGISKKNPKMKFFEADTDYVTKFMSGTGICGCSAFDFTGETVKNFISYDAILVVASEIQLNKTAPSYIPKMMYYDIECLSLQENVFPTADSCPIIQISYILSSGTDKIIDKGVLCLKETPGEMFDSYETEEGMLIKFAQLIRNFNPDAITGYNSNAFDMPYILDRMKALNVYEFCSEITRRKGFKLNYKRDKKKSNQAGTKEVTTYICPGRIMFDLFDLLKGDVTKKLRSYSLKAVCSEFLKGENKEDLRYKDIPILFKTPEGRQKIAFYCFKDTELLIKLDAVLMSGTTTWGMAKVLGTTPQVVLNRGLVFKLMCKIKQYTERFKFVIPSFTKEQRPKFDGKYEGAFVLDPVVGYHTDPVVTLDFASLYPSLMIAYNLSYDTFVRDKKLVEERPQDFEVHCGFTYVKREVYQGLLPKLEEELALERKKARKIRDTYEVGSSEYNVYESLQLANKTIMNSLYGMLGSINATVSNVEIAMTITGLGRDNLLATKDYCESNYQRLTNEPIPCQCIYGDTDSVFIKMPGITIEKSIQYGILLSKTIQKEVLEKRPPMALEYEKVFCPFVITRKKGYCGSKYEMDHTKFKIKAMGIQLVRRDSAILCIEVLQGFIDRVFKENNLEDAKKFVENYISDMFNDKLPLDKYVITKKISKEKYDVEPPFITEWLSEKKRLGSSEVEAIGERMAFIVVYHSKKDGLRGSVVRYQRAIEQNIKDTDKRYYFETFIFNPLEKLMEHICGVEEMKRILNPDNYAVKRTVQANKRNLLSFFGVETYTVEKKRKL